MKGLVLSATQRRLASMFACGILPSHGWDEIMSEYQGRRPQVIALTRRTRCSMTLPEIIRQSATKLRSCVRRSQANEHTKNTRPTSIQELVNPERKETNTVELTRGKFLTSG